MCTEEGLKRAKDRPEFSLSVLPESSSGGPGLPFLSFSSPYFLFGNNFKLTCQHKIVQVVPISPLLRFTSQDTLLLFVICVLDRSSLCKYVEYLYGHIYIHVHTFIYVYTCVYTHEHTYAYTYLRVYIGIIYACMCAFF